MQATFKKTCINLGRTSSDLGFGFKLRLAYLCACLFPHHYPNQGLYPQWYFCLGLFH